MPTKIEIYDKGLSELAQTLKTSQNPTPKLKFPLNKEFPSTSKRGHIMVHFEDSEQTASKGQDAATSPFLNDEKSKELPSQKIVIPNEKLPKG